MSEVDELLDQARFPTRESVEDHLLRRVLPVAYSKRPARPDPPYGLAQAHRWLAHMAYGMHRDGSRDFAWWRLPHRLPRWRRLLGTGAVSGLLSGALFAGLGWVEGEAALGYCGGFPLGPAAAVFNDLFVCRDEHRGMRVINRWIAVGYALAALSTGLITGRLMAGVANGVLPGAVVGLVVGVAIGIPAVTYALHMLAFTVRPSTARGSPLTPAECWRQDVWHSAVFGLLAGALVGVTAAAACLVVGESLLRVAGTLLMIGFVMPAFAFVFSASAKTVLAAVQLSSQGRCPLRPIRFLEDARQRNVLRTAGPVYQFRHARLQDLLARSYAETHDLPFDGVDRGQGLIERSGTRCATATRRRPRRR